MKIMKCPKCGSDEIYEQGTILTRTPILECEGDWPSAYGEDGIIRDTYDPDCFWCGNCTDEFPLSTKPQ